MNEYTPAAQVERLSDQEVADEALVWLNEMRAEYDLPPFNHLPKGERYSPNSCVLAAGLQAVHDNSASVPSYGRYNYDADQPPTAHWNYARDGECIRREAPPVIREFIIRFDEGRYPELVGSPEVPDVIPVEAMTSKPSFWDRLFRRA